MKTRSISWPFICLMFVARIEIHAQKVHPAQQIWYKDSTKRILIIPDFLVWNKTKGAFIPFECDTLKASSKANPLGIRNYNFGCIKTPSTGFWKGQIAKDDRGHAIFESPIYGIRAFIELTIHYFKKGNISLYKYFDRYAPHTDCVGSLKKVMINGKLDCPQGYNQPEIYAGRVAAGLQLDIYKPVNIRDSTGQLNKELLRKLLIEVATFETGKKCEFTNESFEKAFEIL